MRLAFTECARLSFLSLIRLKSAWVLPILAVGGLALIGSRPMSSVEGVTLVPNLVGSTLALLCWILSVLALGSLRPEGRLFGELPEMTSPASLAIAWTGQAVGGAAGFLAPCVVVVAMARLLVPATREPPLAPLLFASALGWLAGVGILLWLLLLAGHLGRASLIAISLGLLLVSLSPEILESVPPLWPVRALFFPLSPALPLTDDLPGGFAVLRLLAPAALYDVGLLLLLAGLGIRSSGGPRRRPDARS